MGHPFGGKINESFCLENTSNLTHEFIFYVNFIIKTKQRKCEKPKIDCSEAKQLNIVRNFSNARIYIKIIKLFQKNENVSRNVT